MARWIWTALGTGLLLAGLAMTAAGAEPTPALSAGRNSQWERQVIYEVNVRQFSQAGTLAAVTAELPRLRTLGVDILWLMPIFPIGELNRKGGLGSPYSVRDYRAVNPDMGSLADLRELTQQAHALGMSVILDWVANHCAWDNPLVKAHPEWLTRDASGQPQAPVADWSDVVDLDFSQESLREFMITAMGYWVSEADVDGFRCDVAGMVPTDFWQAARPRLEEIKPLFMLAEWEDPALAGPFEMSYGWNLHRAGNAYMKGTQDVDGLDSLLRSEAARWPAGHLLMRFITNHDENSWNGTEDERLGAAADAFGVLAWTLPGMPLLYNGQEAGLDRRLAFFEKDEILWACHPRRDLYTQLNRLKHLSPALWSGATDSLHYQRVDCGPAADQVWAFLRFSEAEDLLCVVNLGPEPVELSLTDARLRGTWRVWEDGARLENKASLELKIPAWGWSILRRSAL